MNTCCPIAQPFSISAEASERCRWIFSSMPMHEGAEVLFSRQAGREWLCWYWELALSELKRWLKLAVVQHADPWHAKAAQLTPHTVPAPSLLESWENHMQRGKQPQPEKKCDRQEQAFGSPFEGCSQLAAELSPCTTDATVWSSLYFGQL